MKVCSKCGIEKDESFFRKDIRYKNGVRPQCSECIALYARRWRKENQDRAIFLRERWRKENSNKLTEYSNKYRKKNTEKLKLYYLKKYNKNYGGVYQKKDPIKSKIASEKWRNKNPEKILKLTVKNMLIQQGWPKEMITPELLKMKSIIIKTKRELKKRIA